MVHINWLVFRDAARARYSQVSLRDAPIGIPARHVTDYANPSVPPHMNLTELVEQYILPTGRSCFLVSWGAELEGMVTLQQIKNPPPHSLGNHLCAGHSDSGKQTKDSSC